MDKLFIPVVLGTAREGRQSEKVTNYVLGELRKLDLFETELVDVRDHLFGNSSVHPGVAEPWKRIVTRADGLIIVSPEYNRGIPGELKILLDSLDEEYIKIPVGIIGVSNGKWGGARMAELLLPTLVVLGMVPVTPAIPFPQVQDLFDAGGNILDDSYPNKIASLAGNLVTYVRAFTVARAHALASANAS